MRKRVEQGGFAVQAVAGTHAVFFGFDLAAEARPGCLGFAIYRTDHTENEAYWLSGFKTFRSVVPAPDPTQMYLSDSYPIQSFWWGDYSAKPAHDYSYQVVPRYGAPGSLTSQDGVQATVSVSTSDPGTRNARRSTSTAASRPARPTRASSAASQTTCREAQRRRRWHGSPAGWTRRCRLHTAGRRARERAARRRVRVHRARRAGRVPGRARGGRRHQDRLPRQGRPRARAQRAGHHRVGDRPRDPDPAHPPGDRAQQVHRPRDPGRRRNAQPRQRSGPVRRT